ncbi:MAG: hypothetical protein WAS55_06595 [Saprospiraceae bacterium]|nr:hypothetical protein [Saprospiraceae bacterium]
MYLRILLLLVIGFSLENLKAQFGFQLVAGLNQYPKEQENGLYVPENNLHVSIGPSVWFRLKNRRIEFNPSVIIDYASSKVQNSPDQNLTLKELNAGFTFPILIYPLDFGNDCNCPTFNKQGQFFNKGFHFILYPAAYYLSQTLESDQILEKNASFAYQFGIGAGIDVGINRTWTISPSLVVSKFFNDQYLINDLNKFIANQERNRYRIDFMLRLVWFAKKKRY